MKGPMMGKNAVPLSDASPLANASRPSSSIVEAQALLELVSLYPK
jgi:hypothetical protein